MGEILLYYRRPDPTTWVYLSSFLAIGLYFVFHRFWSIRNLDILLIILLAPGLLIVHEGYRRQLVQSEAIVRSESSGEVPEKPKSDISPVKSLASSLPIFALFQIDTDPVADAAETQNTAEAENSAETLDAPDQTPVAEPIPLGPRDIQRWGFIYLFIVEAFLLLRLMLDPLMVRRPLLDPNLTSGGLTFIGISLFIFMMANVVTSDSRIQVTQGPALGPGYAMMNMLPAIPTRPISDEIGGASLQEMPTATDTSNSQSRLATVAKALAIAAHLAIVTGIVLIGNRHFANIRAGVGCATLYLMLPYTAQMTGRVDHALPAALLLWAVLSYRRPLVAGIFLGLAGGLVYYPLFLLPLWFSFYWQRGARQFAIGVVGMLALLMIALSFDDTASLTEHFRRMFGLLNPNRDSIGLRGFWSLGPEPIWRLPVIVAFVILCAFFAAWPAQKNLGTLISGSAAVMVASQFWHGYGGGLYIAWFLPLLLLAVFRPNLQDRIATKVVITGKRSMGGKSNLAIAGFAAGTQS
ncbi:glycosyltransferase family 87 protein [Rubripirellula reticaptiva]|uniref:Uncharacterized protein n=1 Tax=Rubripirellula reticaptiva TaxID=2528013 RepID=A0A5C6F8V5_9BACT|nr:glycosyltransferase family 87 protein [Rubripirellula reticaptiva]TWU57765.1 hypothetical protein Poly59_06740 [Rubripirellula reticaptiva]